MFNQIELLTPFVIAAYTMFVTPGPNNMMLTYSGARYGFKATLPHILGIILGTLLLNMLAIAGLKPLIDKWPMILLCLKIIGSIWLVLIGMKMARADKISARPEDQKPMSFIAATLFQFANPKAIVATLALVSLILIAIEANPLLMWLIFLILPMLSITAIVPWVFAGQSIRRYLSTPFRWTLFSWVTGGLTAGCALFLWI
jgi:threonine/homoserine/homoserine lactone efflux protein